VPHRVDGLVLVGAPRSLQGRPAFANEVDRLTDPVDPTWVEESLTWFPRYHQVPDWYIKDRIRDGLRVPAHVWMAGLAGLTSAVPPSESATITAPTLIIWGERDELLPLQDGYLLAAAIPGSRPIVYQDTGHLVLWEHPDAAGQVWHLPNDPNTHTTGQLVDLVFQLAGQPRTRLRQIKPWMIRLAALTNRTLRELPEMRYQFEEPFIVDSSKITNTLGVHATPVEQALAETLASYRTPASGSQP
jgi:hypothetical protein